MSNFLDSFPYLQQMNDQFRKVFGDDFVQNMMQSMQSPQWLNGQNPMSGMNGTGNGTANSGGQGAASGSANPYAQGGNPSPAWNPFGNMGMGGMGATPQQSPMGPGGSAGAYPFVDILETKHEVVLVAEVPGLERATDVRISVFPEQVVLKGELNRRGNRTTDHQVILSERRLGPFERVVPMPVRVRKQHAKAMYQQGLLEIRLLKEGNRQETDGTVIDIDFS